MTVRVILRGGLGNQLFQYFAALNFAESTDNKIELNLSWFNNKRNTTSPRTYDLAEIVDTSGIAEDKSNLLRLGLFDKFSEYASKIGLVISELNFDQLKNKKRTQRILFLNGYFQELRFLGSHINNLENFIGIKNCQPEVKDKMVEISERYQVALHLRLGDYVGLDLFHVISKTYIRECLNKINNQEEHLEVLVFTDSPDKANIYLPEIEKIEFIILPKNRFTDPQTLILMSKFKNLILSNSTFSWWAGALASSAGNNVYAPFSDELNSRRNFSKELYLNQWRAVSNS
jgi:hypothetical protein